MEEEVSATVRMGITMLLFSALATACINMFAISDSIINRYTEDFAVAVGEINNISLAALNQTRSVGAPTAYKLIVEHEGIINRLEITYLDGTTTSDYNTLLKNANKNVKVNTTTDGLGNYIVRVMEVE